MGFGLIGGGARYRPEVRLLCCWIFYILSLCLFYDCVNYHKQEFTQRAELMSVSSLSAENLEPSVDDNCKSTITQQRFALLLTLPSTKCETPRRGGSCGLIKPQQQVCLCRLKAIRFATAVGMLVQPFHSRRSHFAPKCHCEVPCHCEKCEARRSNPDPTTKVVL